MQQHAKSPQSTQRPSQAAQKQAFAEKALQDRQLQERIIKSDLAQRMAVRGGPENSEKPFGTMRNSQSEGKRNLGQGYGKPTMERATKQDKSVAPSAKGETSARHEPSQPSAKQKNATRKQSEATHKRTEIAKKAEKPASGEKPAHGIDALDAFVHLKPSQQITGFGKLGSKVGADLDKTRIEVDKSLPGEGTEIRDANTDAEMAQKRVVIQQSNEAHKTPNFDANMPSGLGAANNKFNTDAAKSSVHEGANEQLPDKPAVNADYSVLEAGKADEETKYTAATREGENIIATLDRTIDARGFQDFSIPKTSLEAEANDLQTDKTDLSAEVAAMSEEGKGILDISEFAERTKSGMSEIEAQIAEAEKTRKADTDAQISSHEKTISQEIKNAEEQERQTIEAQKADMDAQIDAQYAEFQSEMASFDAEQQAELEAARTQMDAEVAHAQERIDAEYAVAAKEKSNAEDEAEEKQNEDSSIIDATIDWIKKRAEKAAAWLKGMVAKIVDEFKQFVSNVLDYVVKKVSEINKELGEKLKKRFDQFKAYLNKLADMVVKTIQRIVDTVKDAVKKIADELEASIKSFVKAFKAAISVIWEGLKAAYQTALTGIKTLLSAVGDFFLVLLKKAMELAGVDPSVYENAFSVARQIFDNPGRFFSTLGEGFVDGFKNFGANIGENIKAIFTNLFNMWLGTAGLKLPGEFNLPNLIKFGLDIIGIDVNGVLNALGSKNLEEMESLGELQDADVKTAVENNPAIQTIRRIKNEGIGAIVDMAGEYVSDFVTEIREYAIETIVEKASTAAFAKLAMLACPVSGIVAAIKAVWDLIQFVRENMTALQGLVEAVTSTLAGAAQGDSSGVAAGVEAALCRLIPLAIDLLLRLAGLDVGGAIQGVVGKIRSKIQGVVDKVIGKLKTIWANSSLGKVVESGKKQVAGAKEAAKGKIDSAVDKGIDFAGQMADPYIHKAANAFNQSKLGQKLAPVNVKAQGFADRLNGWTDKAEKKTSGMRKTMGSVTNTLNEFNRADKYGDAFGLDSAELAEGIKSRWKKDEGEDKHNDAHALTSGDGEKQALPAEGDKKALPAEGNMMALPAEIKINNVTSNNIITQNEYSEDFNTSIANTNRDSIKSQTKNQADDSQSDVNQRKQFAKGRNKPHNSKVKVGSRGKITNDLENVFDSDNVVDSIDGNGIVFYGVEANIRQQKAIDAMDKNKKKNKWTKGLTPGDQRRKANYGEMRVDVALEKTGRYKRVSNERIVGVNVPMAHGIDGIYKCANNPPEYLIVEVKNYASKENLRLGTSDYGDEMSNDWITYHIDKALKNAKAECESLKQEEQDEQKKIEYGRLQDLIKYENYLDGYRGEDIVKSNDRNQDLTNINKDIKFLRVLAHVNGNEITYYLLNGSGEIVKNKSRRRIQLTL